jgi:hypothetical protein
MPVDVERRRLIAIIVSVVLLLLLLLLFSDPRSMLRKDSGRIVLQEADRVNGILVLGETDSVRLTRTGQQWYMEGNIRVNPKTAENFLYAASGLSVSSSVPVATLPAGATRQQISFMEGDRTLLAYTFIATGEKTLVQPAGSDLAYYVDLPGYTEPELVSVFSGNPAHYLDRMLISLKPSEISMIRIEPSGSIPYVLLQDSLGDVSLYMDGTDTPVPAGRLDELSIRHLFSYFTSIRFEHRSGIPVDSLTAPGQPAEMARIQVRSRSGKEHTLRIFPFREEPQDDPHMFLALVAFDREPEALVVNYIYLDVLIRSPDHYLSGE